MSAALGAAEGYELDVTVRSAALFVDVRKSSRIIDFVERHHGARAATALFMNYLVGAMKVIDGPTVYDCGPSGDAVLALFTGETRMVDAINAARRVISFVRDEFVRENRAFLTCMGQCRERECPGFLNFHVGAGIDDGDVTAAQLSTGRHSSRQVVGACVSYACKLSGVAPVDSIVISAGMFHSARIIAETYRCARQQVTVGSVRRWVFRIDPPA